MAIYFKKNVYNYKIILYSQKKRYIKFVLYTKMYITSFIIVIYFSNLHVHKYKLKKGTVSSTDGTFCL